MLPITLKCPNCGANLQITPDMETFACGHCGTQQIVRRDGGTVSLKVITDAIAGVKASTDRVAAEMEIRRLRDDAEQLGRQVEKLDKKIEEAKIRGACAPLVVGVLLAGLGGAIFGYPFLCGVIVAFMAGPLCIFAINWINTHGMTREREQKANWQASLEHDIATRLANLK